MSDNKPTGPTGNEFHDKAIAEIWELFKQSEAKAEARQAKADAKAEARQAEAEARQAEADARQADADARQAKTDAQLAKTSKAVAKLIRKLSKGEDQWGRIAEALVGGDLINIMQKRFAITLDDVSLRTRGKYDGKQWEIDIIGVNGDVVVVIEVKTTLSIDDTKYFIRRIIKRFYKLMPRYRHRKVYAGVAYVKTGSNEADVIQHAEDNGLFVIKVVNNTNKIVNSAGFKLRDYRPER